MNFSGEKLKTFPSSVGFLVDTMIQAGKHVYRQKNMVEKPFWLVQSEVFSSFFEKIKHNEQGVNKLKNDVFKPLYEEYEGHFNGNLIDPNNKVQDDFLKVDVNDKQEGVRIVKSQGLFFKAGKGCLPFSDTYSQVVKYNKEKNSPYPLLLLIGLYSSIYNAVKDQETVETNNFFIKNIQILINGLEGCDGVPKKKVENNPMNMLKNMMSNFNIGEMMGDDKMGKEFGDVFSQMQSAMEEGGNPMEAMGKVFKNISSKMSEMEQEQDPDIPVVKEEKVEKVEKVVEEVNFSPKLDDIDEIEELVRTD
jgi:hypothetical protein